MAAGDASSTFTIEVEVDAASATRSAASFFSAFRGATTGLDTEVNKIEKAALGAANSQQKLASNLSTTRYALYDVASTLAITGTALLGLSVGAAAVAIAWERDFAQVVRTTGVVGDEVDELRAGLVDLAQTMPVAFGDVAQIATLAGQLGVAEDRVQSFTETTIKFSTVSRTSPPVRFTPRATPVPSRGRPRTPPRPPWTRTAWSRASRSARPTSRQRGPQLELLLPRLR